MAAARVEARAVDSRAGDNVQLRPAERIDGDGAGLIESPEVRLAAVHGRRAGAAAVALSVRVVVARQTTRAGEGGVSIAFVLNREFRTVEVGTAPPSVLVDGLPSDPPSKSTKVELTTVMPASAHTSAP